METKGTAIQIVPKFVKTRFNDRYEEWLDSLPPASQEILRKPIVPSGWYPTKDAFIIPQRKVCDLFYGGSIRGSTEIGVFSAETTLNGIYRFFIKIGSPQFLMSRASTIFSTFYKPSAMKISEKDQDHAAMQVTEFSEPDEYLDEEIRAFIERALELSGCKEVKVQITKSLAKGDSVTEYVGSWKLT